MRNAVFLALAVFLAMGVHGGIPTSAEGWYTPNGGKFKTTSSTGYVYYFDEDGYWVQNATITVNEDGEITGYDGNIDELGPAYPAYLAMVEALHAETLAKRNKERIEEVGRNLANPLGPVCGVLSVQMAYHMPRTRRLVLNRLAETQTVDNAEFCPRAKSQTGDNCAAYAVATYIETLQKVDRKDAETVNPHEMHDYALAHAPKILHGGNTRTVDCFEYWLQKTQDPRELAIISLVGAEVEGEDKDVDEVRSMTTWLLRAFGAFLASVKTTDEWVLLDRRLENVCRQAFGGKVEAIEGRPVKIKALDGRAASGNHGVVVYGCDAKFVYFLNTWGVTWGNMGRGKITWSEFAKQFRFAELLADREKIDEWVDAAHKEGTIVLQTPDGREIQAADVPAVPGLATSHP